MLKRREMTFSFDYDIPECSEVTKANLYGRPKFGPQEMTLPDGTEFVIVRVEPKIVALRFPSEEMTFNSDYTLPNRGTVIVHLDWPQRMIARSAMVTRVSITLLDAEGMISFAGAHASHPDSVVTIHLDNAAHRMTTLMSDPSWMA